MAYAIVINLDYESNPADSCQEMWDIIKLDMIKAGFRLDSRVFISNLENKEAANLARSVIDNVEAHLDFDKKRVFRYIKDFYGYDTAQTNNLLVPGSD